MKNLSLSKRGFLTIALLTLSSLSFTQIFKIKEPTEGTNQSFVIFDNGEVSSIRSYFPEDEEIKLIDNDNLFILPSNIGETRANYLFDKDGELYTVDAHGYMYHKEFYRIDSKIKYYGGNYFITKSGQIHIIKNDGIIFSYAGIDGVDLTRIEVAGGNYFITKDDRLFTINFEGYYSDKTELFKDKAKEIKHLGNNYFITKEGIVYTSGTEIIAQIDASGNPALDENQNIIPLLDTKGRKQYFSVVYHYEKQKMTNIVKLGGNYFFDNENHIHTVSSNGILDRGILNRKLKVNLKEDKDRSYEQPVHFGNNYFVYEDGAMYMVDREGYYYFVKQLNRRVQATNFQAKLNK